MAGYGCNGGGGSMYTTTDDCYVDTGRHGHSHGHNHGHGHGGGMRVQSHTEDYYCNDGDDRRMAPAAYGDNCGGYGGGAKQAVYSEEYSRTGGYGGGGGGGGQEYYKREEREHKHKERLGEVGALASGAFALYEGQKVKKDPAHAQRHRIEEGVAAAAAVGAGGYAYHEHREHKEATYGDQHVRRPQQQAYGYCN